MKTLVLTFVLLASVGSPATAQPVIERARLDVDSLASPAFEGRGYEGEGHLRAAAFLERGFREAGLAPVAGTYRQSFTFDVDLIRNTPVLLVDGVAIPPGSGFLPIASSPSDTLDGARIVYAGGGWFAPDAGVNDYTGIDVAGAVVIVQADAPLPEGVPALARTARYRVEAAAHLGARAIILLTETLSHGPFPQNTPIPGFLLHADHWPGGEPRVAYRLDVALDEPVTTYNVMGRVEGVTMPGRHLVVMAHYDHVGRLGPAPFFPGANDNASGIAMLLALARQIAADPLRRSVLFVAFSGEEQGLLGSQAFVSDPPIPLETIDFVLNLDMVASGEDGIMVVGGSDYPEAFDLLNEVNAGVGISRIGRRPNAPNSDHYPFLEAGIPGFFFYTNRGTQPYHSVDDVPATLEWDDFLQVFTLAESFLRAWDAR